jgi:hypothetical protein
MEEINIPLTILYHLTHGEMSRFNRSVIANSAPDVNDIARLQLVYDGYNAAFNTFERSFKKPLVDPKTEPIRLLDIDRKGAFFVINTAVRSAASHSPIAEVKAAAKVLTPLLNIHSDTMKIEYEGETGAIDKLVKEFESPEYAVHIARLGQTENVAVLKQINIDFQKLYENRYNRRHKLKQEGTTREHRKTLIMELGKFCRAVNGLVLTASDPVELAALQSIVRFVNATFEQYANILHRRMGVAAAKKKKGDKNKDDEKEDGKDKGNKDGKDISE